MDMERMIEKREAERRRDAELRLQEAIEKGNYSMITLLLDRGVSPNAKAADPNTGMSLLHIAAEKGDAGAVLMLLEKGAELNPTSYLLDTPLMLASKCAKPLAAKLLIERGANVHVEDREKNTALHFAAEYGRAEICEALIAAGAKIDALRHREKSDSARPLHLAAKSGDAQTCRVLLNAGAKLEASDLSVYTPLHHAAAKGHLEVCRLLVERGAQPDRITDPILHRSASRSPLQEAVVNGHAEVAKFFLLHCNANHASKSLYGETLDQLAKKSGNQEIIRVLRALESQEFVASQFPEASQEVGAPKVKRSSGMSPM